MNNMHNHVTRDIKQLGQCPSCDDYHRSQVTKQRTMRPEEWILSNDTGTSSKAIWAVMMGVGTDKEFDNGTPSDPSDFGRCYRLLEAFPDWKARLNEVAARYPRWKAMISSWEECERLYLRDLPTGKCSELYELMKKLRK